MEDKERKRRGTFSLLTFRGLFANVMLLTVLGLLLTGYAGLLCPRTWSWLSLAGYAFPLFLAATLFELALCVFIKKRLLVIPFIGLLLAYQPVTLYCPVNTPKEAPEDAIKFVSFNTYNWSKGEYGKDDVGQRNPIVEYLQTCEADIICLQEAPLYEKVKKDIDELLTPRLPYTDTVRNERGCSVTIISRFPIVKKQLIQYETIGNVSGAFWLDINGREVMVVVNHLQTMGFSMDERKAFGDMMHGKQDDTDEIKSTSRTIIGKILDASRTRSWQAEAVAQLVRENSDKPIIVCGDFNDIPQSYTYHTISKPGTGKDGNDIELTDCYRASGFGPGFSYGHFGMKVRIDNILCSKHFTPYECSIDQSNDFSDHYPISCKLSF